MEYIPDLKINEKTKASLAKLIQVTKTGRGLTVPEMLLAGNWTSVSLFYQQIMLCLAHEWITKNKSPGNKLFYMARLDRIAMSKEEEQGREVLKNGNS